MSRRGKVVNALVDYVMACWLRYLLYHFVAFDGSTTKGHKTLPGHYTRSPIYYICPLKLTKLHGSFLRCVSTVLWRHHGEEFQAFSHCKDCKYGCPSASRAVGRFS